MTKPEIVSDYIPDGLGFACTGRTFKHEVSAFARGIDGNDL